MSDIFEELQTYDEEKLFNLHNTLRHCRYDLQKKFEEKSATKEAASSKKAKEAPAPTPDD
mgnify:CR=1 FL=1